MANIIVLGGGICGLGTALLLARDGHEITVLERDASAPPETPQAAWEDWQRRGVAQFRQPHNFMPGLRLLLEEELPDVQEALVEAGAGRFDLVRPLPPFFDDDSSRPVDDKLWTYTARRPVGEWVFARAAEKEARVTVRRGVRATGFIAGTSVRDGVPHVVGLTTDDDDQLYADLIIDAMGRRSKSPDWLEAIGARRPHEESEDSGFTYYTRFFHGDEPERRAPVLTALGTISILTLPGDNGTWSVTVFAASGDPPLKELRRPATWTAVVGACPLHAHWLEGTAISDVYAMSGIVDRYRRFIVDGSPVATGMVAVADASSCTNPSAGRGLTVGFLHARRLRDVIRDTANDPAALVDAFDAVTDAEITPWYRAQIATDRARFAQIEALRAGREPPHPSDPLAQQIGLLLAAMMLDPDMFRQALEYLGTITPVQRILERPVVAEKLRAAAVALQESPPMQIPGPSREQLLDLVG